MSRYDKRRNKNTKECARKEGNNNAIRSYNTLAKFVGGNRSVKLKAVLNEASCSDIYTVQVIALRRGNSRV